MFGSANLCGRRRGRDMRRGRLGLGWPEDVPGRAAAEGLRYFPRTNNMNDCPDLAEARLAPFRWNVIQRSARLILLLYLDKRGRPKVRIHGRPRSDRKRRFLLSAVAPSTSTRHPREARPTNWAQRGGLASGRGNVS